MSTSTVSLADIDAGDRFFALTAGRDARPVEISLRAVGLLNPVCLAPAASPGRYRIVCGFRRIAAARKLGWSRVSARVFGAAVPEKELFLAALHDNLSHRVFNPVEAAAAAAGLVRYFPDREVVSHYLPLLGRPAAARSLADLVSLAGLEDDLKEGILTGVITEKTAVRLAALAPDDRRHLYRLFCRAHFSSSKQAEVLESCLDLARRGGLRAGDIVQHPDIEQALSKQGASLSQKADMVRRLLRQRRFPRLNRREEQFSEARRGLRLPQGVELAAPPFFEGETYRLQIAFQTPAELHEAAEQIGRAAHSGLMRQLLEGPE